MKNLWIALMICALCASFAACAVSEPEETTTPTTEATESIDWGPPLDSINSGCSMDEDISE